MGMRGDLLLPPAYHVLLMEQNQGVIFRTVTCPWDTHDGAWQQNSECPPFVTVLPL